MRIRNLLIASLITEYMHEPPEISRKRDEKQSIAQHISFNGNIQDHRVEEDEICEIKII